MSVSLMPIPKQAFFYVDNSGRQVPLVGGKVYTYLAGTSTPAATYTSSTGATANAWPVILDARGEASVWLTPGLYKIVLKDANDVEIYTQDGVSGTGLYTVFDDMDTLIANVGTFDGQLAFICGYHAVGDGGGGFFRWNAASTATHDGGITIKATASATGRWIRLFDGPVNALWYGLISDGATTNSATLLNNASRAALAAADRALYIPSGHYVMDGTFKFDSGITIYGDGIQSRISHTTSNVPVMASRNYYAAEGVSASGNTIIRNLYVSGNASAGSSNHGILLRDYYTTISDVLVAICGGDGVKMTHLNDASAATGNLVENRVIRVTASNNAGYGLYLGDSDNNRITDGFVIDCIMRSTATTPSHLYIGSAAGWKIDGVHTYGSSAPTSHSLNIINSYHTMIDNVYIEGFGTHGINAAKIQRALSISNVHVKNTVSGAAAVRLDMSSIVTSCEVTVTGLNVVNSSANTVIGIQTLDAGITVRTAGCSFSNTGGGSITKYSATGAGVITRTDSCIIDDAIITGEVRESTNNIGLKHRGQYLALAAKKNFTPSNPAVSIAVQFDITTIRSYNSMVGTVHVNSRTNYNGTRRCTYMGQVYIQAKDNTTDPWVVVMDTIITPAGFSSNPAATISNNTDGTGTLTITFTPSNTDDYGSVALLLTPGETT